jgi:hypothetical protein
VAESKHRGNAWQLLKHGYFFLALPDLVELTNWDNTQIDPPDGQKATALQHHQVQPMDVLIQTENGLIIRV